MQRLRSRLAERRLTLEVTPAAEKPAGPAGYDPDFGARPLRRAIQRQVEDPLALALLEGRYPGGSTVTVDERDGEVVLVERRHPVGVSQPERGPDQGFPRGVEFLEFLLKSGPECADETQGGRAASAASAEGAP